MLKILSFVEELHSDEKKHVRAEISVSDSSELATEAHGYIFEDASIAWDITNGDFYGLVDGNWVKQND